MPDVSPTPGTLPPYVAPAGGPQPAKRSEPAIPWQRVFTPAKGRPSRKVTGPDLTPVLAQQYLAAQEIGKYTGSRGRGSFLGTPVDNLGIANQIKDAASVAYNGLKVPTASEIDTLARQSSTYGELAQKLGADPASFAEAMGATPNTPLVSRGQTPAADKVNADFDELEKQLADAYGETTDPDDPLSYVKFQPRTSQELGELLLQVNDAEALGSPEQYEAAKKAIMDTEAVFNAQQEQLNAIYLAGLEGRPMPAFATPTESTDQSSYITAGDPKVAKSVFTPETQAAGTTDLSDQAILDMANLIQQKQEALRIEQRNRDLGTLAQQVGAYEKEVADAEATAAKKAQTEEGKRAATREEAAARQLWAETYRMEIQGNVAGGETLMNQLARRFSAGASERDAIKSVFGDEKTRMSDLTVPEMRLVQVAQVLAGANIPPQLEGRYQTWRDEQESK